MSSKNSNPWGYSKREQYLTDQFKIHPNGNMTIPFIRKKFPKYSTASSTAAGTDRNDVVRDEKHNVSRRSSDFSCPSDTEPHQPPPLEFPTPRHATAMSCVGDTDSDTSSDTDDSNSSDVKQQSVALCQSPLDDSGQVNVQNAFIDWTPFDRARSSETYNANIIRRAIRRNDCLKRALHQSGFNVNDCMKPVNPVPLGVHVRVWYDWDTLSKSYLYYQTNGKLSAIGRHIHSALMQYCFTSQDNNLCIDSVHQSLCSYVMPRIFRRRVTMVFYFDGNGHMYYGASIYTPNVVSADGKNTRESSKRSHLYTALDRLRCNSVRIPKPANPNASYAEHVRRAIHRLGTCSDDCSE